MSLLAKRAVLLVLSTKSFMLDGQHVIEKDKVTEVPLQVLQTGGASSCSSARNQVRMAWQEALEGQERPSGLKAPFVGVYFACRQSLSTASD